MRQLKVIFIAMEIASLICVISLAFCEFHDEESKFFQSMFIAALSIFAVTMQREQQSIDWDLEEEEV